MTYAFGTVSTPQSGHSQLMHPAQPKIAPPTAASLAADRLLLVEDHAASVQALQSMLGKHGFEILAASSVPQVLKILQTDRPDLILLKLKMPGVDAFELCERIQENPAWADIPIVFFSAAHDQELVTRALESGGVDYMAQPFSKPELLSRLRTHLMLKTTRDHLKQLAKEKDDLLGMISHHLQNNLAGINMSAQLLIDRLSTGSDARSCLIAENVRRTSSEMRVFIRSLLSNAAADRGVSINLEPIRLSEAVTRVLRQYQDAACSKELTLRSELPNEGVFIRADPAALDQVLDNLISNAVKFSPPKREVSVTLLRRPAHMECWIQDQGPGFTEEDKRRMFHRYTRLSARPTAGEPSTGLGLSIAKKLVHAMHGELTCQSSPGQGATFVLGFPITREQA
jgi:two-component system, sensor histidine kinase and response regulator